MNKRDFSIGLLAALSGAALMGGAAQSGAGLSEEEAYAALKTWYAALRSNDPKQVELVLAPEFQILRADGSGYDHHGYLGALPHVMSDPVVSKLTFTSNGDLMVARYMVESKQTVNGQSLQTIAPRLSVMRRQDGKWLMVSHANFAQIT